MVELLVQRYGRQHSELDRGGIWFTVINNDIQLDSEYRAIHRNSGIYNYALIDVFNPIFIDTFIFNEKLYPFLLYGALTNMGKNQTQEFANDTLTEFEQDCVKKSEYEIQHYSSCVERRYAELEKHISYLMKKKGYDGAIFTKLTKDGVLYEQLFYVNNPAYIRWFK